MFACNHMCTQLISLPILFPFIYYLRPFRFGVVKQFFDSTEYVLAFCRDLHAHLRYLCPSMLSTTECA